MEDDQTWPVQDRRSQAVMAVGLARPVSADPNAVTLAAEAVDRWRSVAAAAIEAFGGVQFPISGDGLFALFENARKAVQSALSTQARLAQTGLVGRSQLRIGVHQGEVLVLDNQLFGETPEIAAGLESAAEGGEVLVSLEVRDEAVSQVAASFKERGVITLVAVSRSINTFSVGAAETIGANAVAALKDAGQSETPAVHLRAVAKPPIPLGDPNLPHLDETLGAGCGKVSALPARPPLHHGPSCSPQAPDRLPSARAPQEPRSAVQTAAAAAIPAGQTPASQREAASPDAGYIAQPALFARVEAPPKRPLIPDCPAAPAQAPPQQVVNGSTHKELTKMLMLRLGPITPMIIRRTLGTASTLAEFIDGLGDEIPSASERAQFLAEAKALLIGSKT